MLTNRLAAVLILAAVLALPLCADRLTVDPNAAGDKPANETKQAQDPRLDKKITYHSGGKRLHAVVEELAQLTGVTIRCGSSAKDWQVRDIPVVVCAKDLPLGKLLKTLAEAAHVSLRTERPEEKGAELRYRLTRDGKTWHELGASVENKRQQAIAVSKWAWDTLTTIGGMSDEDLQKMEAKEPDVARVAPLGRLVAALGPDAKAKLFAGEQISVNDTDSPHADIVKRLCAAFQRADDSQGWSVSFSLSDTGLEPQGVTLTVLRPPLDTAAPSSGTTTRITTGASPIYLSHSLENGLPASDKLAKVGFPARPQAQDGGGASAPSGFGDLDSKAKPLSAQVTIEKPKNNEHPTFADAVTAISKASGISIIAEDFVSHKLSKPELQGLSVYDQKTPAEAIRSLGRVTRWFGSEDGELIVGWSSEWHRSHVNLMPKSVLDDLTKKLKGDGATLDDFAELALWTRDQRADWFDRSGDLGPLADINVYGQNTAIWQFYTTLTPRDKALAQSEGGLPFAKFDPQWLSTFLRDAARKDIESMPDTGMPDIRRQVTLPMDVDALSSLTLKIAPLTIPGETGQYYRVTLSSEGFSTRVDCPARFPIKARSMK